MSGANKLNESRWRGAFVRRLRTLLHIGLTRTVDTIKRCAWSAAALRGLSKCAVVLRGSPVSGRGV